MGLDDRLLCGVFIVDDTQRVCLVVQETEHTNCCEIQALVPYPVGCFVTIADLALILINESRETFAM